VTKRAGQGIDRGVRFTGGHLAAGVLAAVVLGAGSFACGSASAADLPAVATGHHWGGGDQRNGNGRFNRVSSPYNSPNFNRGVQHIINANSGGRTINQTNFCKWKSYCKTVQQADFGW
jgi:hypothetical protein